MSRVIKVRAWTGTRMDYDYRDVTVWHGLLVPEGDTILMQFTGLRDRHGKEIYEGDVVRWEDRGSDYPNVLILTTDVHWVNVGWNLNSKIIEYEILGNIYEHPELVK